MNKAEILKSVEAPVNENIPQLFPGDAVNVHLLIKEGNRERVQVFKGTVLFVARAAVMTHHSPSAAQPAMGSGVERTFLLRSPRIQKSSRRTAYTSPPCPAILPAGTNR